MLQNMAIMYHQWKRMTKSAKMPGLGGIKLMSLKFENCYDCVYKCCDGMSDVCERNGMIGLKSQKIQYLLFWFPLPDFNNNSEWTVIFSQCLISYMYPQILWLQKLSIDGLAHIKWSALPVVASFGISTTKVLQLGHGFKLHWNLKSFKGFSFAIA